MNARYLGIHMSSARGLWYFAALIVSFSRGSNFIWSTVSIPRVSLP